MTADRDEGLIRVLLVEDDERLAQLTAKYLQMRGLVVTVAYDGVEGFTEAKRATYDVILLDLLLPRMSGTEVCREIRKLSDVPIIMVTALGDEPERVSGLELGADDYVSKPFSSAELLARIRAAVRRYRGQAGPSSRHIEVGALSLDPSSLTTTLEGRSIDLTPYEFSLLLVLAERAGRVLSREQLLDLAKGSAEESFDRSVDTHISKIRKKLGDDPKKPTLLKTIRGHGYMLARVVDES
jgi:two-component system, OmpR family, response regulator